MAPAQLPDYRVWKPRRAIMISGMILWAIGFNGYQGSRSQVLSPTATASIGPCVCSGHSFPFPFPFPLLANTNRWSICTWEIYL